MLQEDYKIVKDQIGPCGIRCGECHMGMGNIAERAIDLKKYLEMYDVKSWAGMLPGGKDVDIVQLEKNLAWVSTNLRCPGCLNGGGSPDCPIRICSKEKGHSSCGKCSDLRKCGKFEYLGEKGKTLKESLSEHR